MDYSHFFCFNFQTTLGEFGCRQGCCVMSDSSHDNKFVVASNEVTSFYLPKEAAQCFGFEGKTLQFCFNFTDLTYSIQQCVIDRYQTHGELV